MPEDLRPPYARNSLSTTPGSPISRYSSVRDGDVTRINRIGGRDLLPGKNSIVGRRYAKEDPSANAATYTGTGSEYGAEHTPGVALYKPGMGDVPSTHTHEMIHQSQMRTPDTTLPSASDMRRMHWRPGPTDPQFEAPAYGLSSDESYVVPGENRELALRRYVDRMRQLGATDRSVSSIQAAEPDRVQKNVMNRYPPPVAFPPIPQELRGR